MLEPREFFSCLKENDIDFFTGVPDSLLKYFCAYVTDNVSDENNIIAANEGNAIGIATGYHLATGKIPLVYMQNSGIGNAVNPLLSLVDKEVYNIPVLLMIGWRGEPDKKDACQHMKQGRITPDLLDTMEIPYIVLSEDISEVKKQLKQTIEEMKGDNIPRAIIVRKNTFSEYKLKQKDSTSCELTREEAIEVIIKNLGKDDIVVSSTGKISREVFEVRNKLGQGHENDFLMVGSMGHASQIALGIALNKPNRRVVCLDGDGAVIMHMGGLSTIALKKPHNFKHVILNNCAHDSVGGQPTAAPILNCKKIAEGSGYTKAITASDSSSLNDMILELLNTDGPSMLEVKVKKGSREDLSRPDIGPIERKKMLMRLLEE